MKPRKTKHPDICRVCWKDIKRPDKPLWRRVNGSKHPVPVHYACVKPATT